MNPYRYKVSLRINHPSLKPSEITAALGIDPSRTWEAGRPRTGPTGAPLDGINRETYWTARLAEEHSETYDLPSALHTLIDGLARHAPLFRQVRLDGGSVEFFIGWFFDKADSGEVFEPDLLGRLSELGIGVSLDIYSGPKSSTETV